MFCNIFFLLSPFIKKEKLSFCHKYVEVDDENYCTGEVVEEEICEEYQSKRMMKLQDALKCSPYNVESSNFKVVHEVFFMFIIKFTLSFWLSLFNCNDFHGTSFKNLYNCLLKYFKDFTLIN